MAHRNSCISAIVRRYCISRHDDERQIQRSKSARHAQRRRRNTAYSACSLYPEGTTHPWTEFKRGTRIVRNRIQLSGWERISDELRDQQELSLPKYCLRRQSCMRPEFPLQGVTHDLTAARQWAMQFVQWYKHEHRHSGIRYVTTGTASCRPDRHLLEARHAVYQSARQRNPQRWSGNTT